MECSVHAKESKNSFFKNQNLFWKCFLYPASHFLDSKCQKILTYTILYLAMTQIAIEIEVYRTFWQNESAYFIEVQYIELKYLNEMKWLKRINFNEIYQFKVLFEKISEISILIPKSMRLIKTSTVESR